MRTLFSWRNKCGDVTDLFSGLRIEVDGFSFDELGVQGAAMSPRPERVS